MIKQMDNNQINLALLRGDVVRNFKLMELRSKQREEEKQTKKKERAGEKQMS